ncbi:MAG: MarR family transcriptional regulator [Eubacteriales bacterium]|nr:MarR family transcriptional regulator [Eubacteriales bacterium]
MEYRTCLNMRCLHSYIRRYAYKLYSRKKLEDCSLGNMLVVDYIYRNPDKEIYQKDIERIFYMNRATTSKMLKLMEEKELIERRVSEKDSRYKAIFIKEKGYELQKVCVSVFDELEKTVNSKLTAEEVELLNKICFKLIDGLKGEIDIND